MAYTIHGQLLHARTRQLLANLKVEAFYRRQQQVVLNQSTTSDSAGRFKFEFSEDTLGMLSPNQPPVAVFFQVYRGNEVLPSSGTINALQPQDHQIAIKVDVPEVSGGYRVRGAITSASGLPVSGVQVRAFDRDMRHEQPLGEKQTDSKGFYEITYSRSQFRRAEKEHADLVIRVMDENGNELGDSDVIFNAEPVQTIDLTLQPDRYRGPSEYERYVEALAPLIEDVPLADLTDKDLEFLTGETGIPAEHLRFLRLDAQWRRKHDVDRAVFYGLLRQGLPANDRRLLAEKLSRLREALVASLRQNIIPGQENNVDSILERLQDLAVKAAFEQDDEAAAPPLGVLLNTAPDLPKELQRQFVRFALRYENNREADFWDKLREETDFSEEAVRAAQFTVGLGALSRHAPLVQRFQRERQQGSITELRHLARLTVNDWQVHIAEAGFPPDTPGEDEEEKARNYALHMARGVETNFPTASVAYKLERASGLEMPLKQEISRFVLEAPEFDLARTNINAYMAEHPAPDGIDDPEVFKRELKRVQRVFKLAPEHDRFETMQVLLENGLDSAHAVSDVGETRMLREYSDALGGESRTTAIARRAGYITAETQILMLGYGGLFNPISLPVTADRVAESGKIPELAELFGSLSFCECEHCRSVYSPAAYLVDLLHWLEAEVEALGALTNRRPDIRKIELSCKNTNTVLPYVDLVNEILERAVAPLLFDFEEPPAVIRSLAGELDSGAMPTRIRDEFNEIGIPLSDNPEVIIKSTGREWAITDEERSYNILNIGDEGIIASAGTPQTRGTAEELRVQPEYINSLAYKKLAEAVYPWNLPFDLWTEEARIFLNHLGVPRYELMEVLGGGAPPGPLHVSRERLGLTTRERELVTGSDASEPYERWGLEETDNVLPDLENPEDMVSLDWIDALRRVPVFMARSELSFNELTELLTAEYINPVGAITVEFPVPETEEEALLIASCDLTKATLTLPAENAAAAEVLERIQRFVRLQRKLGWPVRELNAALRALPPNELTDEFLIQLAYVVRLREKLKVPVLEMLSWWSGIDTVRFGDQPSLYEQRFLNRAVSDPVDPAFKLNAAGNELATTTDTVEDHKPTILAALEITEKELSLLVEQVLTDTTLNLENLSVLYRCVSFARPLRLSIEDFLRARKLVDVEPFDPADTSQAWRFARKVEKIRASGFSVAELDYLLRHRFPLPSPIAPADTEIGRVLEEIRTGLQTVAEEQSFGPETTDPSGELLQAKLALLNWDQALIEQVIATFNDAVTYNAPLTTLPEGLIFPPNLRETVYYVANAGGTGELRFKGAMTIAERDTLLDLSGDSAYRTAVESLFETPRTFVSRNMRSFEPPHYAAPLAASLADSPAVLPHGLTFPRELNDRVYYDRAVEELRFVGAMTVNERKTLLYLADHTAPDYPVYESTINTLFDAPDSFAPEPEDEFLSAADIATLFDAPAGTTPDEVSNVRFALVLEKLVPYLRDRLSERLVVQRLGDALGLEMEVMQPLLTRWITLPSDSMKPAACAFLDYREDCRTEPTAPVFSESSPHLTLTRETFSEVFQTYTRLHKAALVANRLDFTRPQLSWLFEYEPDVGWLDLNALPLAPTDSAASLFAAWERLADLADLRNDLPLGEKVLEDLFAEVHADTPSKQTYIETLVAWTDWSKSDLETFLGETVDPTATGLLGAAFPNDYRDERLLVRLTKWFRLLKRLGVSADEAALWGQADLTPEIARSIRRAAKAKHGRERWYTIAAPLQDELRKRQRNALVAYLVAHGPDGGDSTTFEDADDLFGHYLIDVEMDPCMMTSRIKQANSSVQLFVQRSLMSLEPEVQIELKHARQWKTWMKNYRVWEANRKVFLYPENWIEPELRDNKSPFFKDLENALLQNEIREDTVEDAFLGYLEKLDEVARLEMAGMYHQKEEDLDILHVFGRTRNTPHIYYYRRWMDQSYWTPWERVDVDIQGDHLIPVIWNRRLYLFWPIFTEKADEPGEVTEDETGSPPVKYWNIQIAWSENKHNKWTAKKVSSSQLNTLAKAHLRQYFFLPIDWQGSLFVRVRQSNVNESGRWSSYNRIGEFVLAGCDKNVHSYEENTVFTDDPFLRPMGAEYEYMGIRLGGDTDLEMVQGDAGEDLAFLGTGVHRIPTLGNTPTSLTLYYPSHLQVFVSQSPFFYEDTNRTFFVTPVEVQLSSFKGTYEGEAGRITIPLGSGKTARYSGYQFSTSYHPFTCTFIKELNRHGISGLLNPAKDGGSSDLRRQLIHDYYFGPERPERESENLYAPEYLTVLRPYPKDDIDFSYRGSYSLYNWELFFHAPLLIADRLSKNQRFEEAMQWFHYIFDPTIGEDPSLDASDRRSPARFWKVKPFFQNERTDEEGRPYSIRFLLDLLHYDGSDSELRELKRDFENQIDEWRDKPFNPHLIARLRTSPYQWAVVMKYLDNLIAWGDQLFRRDTIESINEATQLYILAAQILGDRPVQLPAQRVRDRTYNQLKNENLGAFSNALVEIENAIAPSIDGELSTAGGSDGMPRLRTLYFCVPPNEKLLGYWDTVTDRLFKIRHCMNIEGVVRQLPLFEPPIEPGMLVRAAAAGVDLSSVLSDVNAPLPHYRFQVMLQKAVELCGDVRALGGALLSALEKKDAEELALMRSKHELKLLDSVRQIKEQQIEEATEALKGLQKSKEITKARRNYYRDIERINEHEQVHMDSLGTAHVFSEIAQGIQTSVAAAHTVPNFDVGTAGWAATPVVKASFGGNNLGSALQSAAGVLEMIARQYTHDATMASIKGGYDRRWDDWKLQESLANKELEQIDKQIAAAEIRLAISEKELENHDLQTENAQEVDTYMRQKFTNRELYGWMVSQLSALYFQSYQLAYDLAKRAERAYRHELGLTDSNFIQFGYWDSLKKGLLAGEKLHHDLKRMDVAYLEQNKREYELTKHVSLVLLQPEALVRLRETGECFFHLPEVIFDLDYPGHYMRRIKSVSLTLPSVTGPYTNVSCTVTLQSNRIRKNTNTAPSYAWTGDTNDDRFIYNLGGIQSIATSSAREDSGLFELNFRDERYLPFEGAGVIGNWRLELPQEFRQFDYDTISDVILHVHYTARDGGAGFAGLVNASLTEALNRWLEDLSASGRGLFRMFSLRQEFSSQFHQFLHPKADDTAHETLLTVEEKHFPHFLLGMEFVLAQDVSPQILVVVKPRSINNYSTFAEAEMPVTLVKNGSSHDSSIASRKDLGNLPTAAFPSSESSVGLSGSLMGDWMLAINRSDVPEDIAIDVDGQPQLNPEMIEDIFLFIRYEVRVT
ncbi:Tc toxin subunit A-related protein [Methylohalobius crimeensis]|uniref:Tc toxin subunit A-related protein n=1 Tax=Methylohalobius crimeensis TaxID=244365 RepID=UPI0003B37D33|nr:neuraminidase-like domain-containing protein [Methylohalobius crimeensis]